MPTQYSTYKHPVIVRIFFIIMKNSNFHKAIIQKLRISHILAPKDGGTAGSASQESSCKHT